MKILNLDTDVENIPVVGGNLDISEKVFLIENLIKGYSLARKNKKRGAMTTASYSCGLVTEDNKVYFGINFNNTRSEISSICAERLAILSAFKSKVEEYEENTAFSYKIKYILVASYKNDDIFYEENVTPCADCLSWFNADEHFGRDAKIVCLKNNSNGIFLDIQPLEDFLPLRNMVIKTQDNPKTVKRSEYAKNAKISDEVIINLYKKTYNAFKSNEMSATSGQNVAAGIIANGEIFTGIKVDFSKRWFIEPLRAAFYKAVEKFGQKTKVSAICYVGDEYTKTETGLTVKDGIISLQTLGRLNTKFTNEDTVVITGGVNSLEVHTLNEFMPLTYKFMYAYEIK